MQMGPGTQAAFLAAADLAASIMWACLRDFILREEARTFQPLLCSMAQYCCALLKRCKKPKRAWGVEGQSSQIPHNEIGDPSWCLVLGLGPGLNVHNLCPYQSLQLGVGGILGANH
jgi:hypothetical protein